MIPQMKTSNKLLIALGLGILLLIGLIQVVLYSNYRQGRIISPKELHIERYIRYDMAAPSYLSLNGIMWVNIIPSDTFYVEFPKETRPTVEEKKISTIPGLADETNSLSYRESGDTLLITGNNNVAIHRPFADGFYRANQAQVNIYCRGLKEIFFCNGQLYLHGADHQTGMPSAKLHIDSSTLWIGDYLEPKPAAKEFFDSLDIRSLNSVFLLNRSASIHKLRVQMDDGSELNDRQAQIDSLMVNYSSDSRVGLTGGNLKKAHLLAH
jgi:hypothetical protein